MIGSLGRRLALAVPTLVGLSVLVFVLIAQAPGDPAEEYARRTSGSQEVTQADVERARHDLGLDRPLIVQYTSWLGGAVTGDLGTSFSRGTPVADEIAARAPATAELAMAALLLVIVSAVPLGLAAAALRGRWPDHLLRVLALVGGSVPGFFLAYLLITLFATTLGVLPVAGRQGLSSVVLPALTLAVGPAALVSRLLRSSLLEVLGENFIRTARGKGLSETRTLLAHALRAAVNPVVTVLGTVLAGLLEGAVIAEVVFAWPGLGRLAFEAISQRDYPMVLGVVVVAGAVFVLVNIVVDVSYSMIDPRVRNVV